MDCIPAGMELSPATDEEQRALMKQIIEDCDYFILLIAGRYGSTTAEGISYTEREFDHAVELGIPVLAFLQGDPDSIPAGQLELEPGARQRLAEFRQKVSRDRLIRTWHAAGELPGLVALSLTKLIKAHPRPGWARGPGLDATGLLRQMNELRQENEALKARLQSLSTAAAVQIPDLAAGEAKYELSGTYKLSYNGSRIPWKAAVSWNDMLYHIGPELLQLQHDSSVNRELARSLLLQQDKSPYEPDIDHEIFKTVRIQLMALQYVEVQPLNTTRASTALFWRLTQTGHAQLMRIRTVKKSPESSAT